MKNQKHRKDKDMGDKITPPILTGTDSEKLAQLIVWISKLCTQLNIKFDSIEAGG